jgi:hypothetical protein
MRTRSPSSAPPENGLGVHGDDRDALAAPAVLERELGDERALARARGPGDADPERPPRAREAGVEDGCGVGVLVLDPRDGPGQRHAGARQQAVDHLGCREFLRHGSSGICGNDIVNLHRESAEVLAR